ncbi:hypothetical protein SeLEV6574_g07946 [Synchytrium endobioticum]|nr:hypothetical protein SeLEV6574_g07946 [Synchytrium endobioticum]
MRGTRRLAAWLVPHATLAHTRHSAILPAACRRPPSLAIPRHHQWHIRSTSTAPASLAFDERQIILTLPIPAPNGPSSPAPVPVRFAVCKHKPISDLLAQIAEEYPSAHPVAALAAHGRWARSTPADDVLKQALLDRVFVLELADRGRVSVDVPTAEARTLSLKRELDEVEKEIAVLCKIKDELDRAAELASQGVVWVGLAGLCAQWGVMLR